MEPVASGLVDSARAFVDGLLGSVRDRVELVSVELQEEKQRLIQIFVWISLAIFAGMMAMAFASFTLVYVFWESSRTAALAGVTLLYAGGSAVAVLTLRKLIARHPKPFKASLEELDRDRSCIRMET